MVEDFDQIFKKKSHKEQIEQINPMNHNSDEGEGEGQNEEDKIVIKSKEEKEYAKRFIDYGNNFD